MLDMFIVIFLRIYSDPTTAYAEVDELGNLMECCNTVWTCAWWFPGCIAYGTESLSRLRGS
jgi:hypothetical protein